MYHHKVAARCESCGFAHTEEIFFPDEGRDFHHRVNPFLEGWLLASGYPHLCPSCNTADVLESKFGIKVPEYIEEGEGF